MTCCQCGAWRKLKSGLARCRVSKASPSITLRKAPRCATMKPDFRSPISSRPCAKAGMSHQANPHQRRKRPRTRPRRRARRLQHPLPPRRNLPRTRLPSHPRPHPLRRNPPLLRHPRLPLPQATEKRTKQRRTRRRQHPQPLHRNLPRTRLLPPPAPRPSCPMQNPQRLGASPQQNQQPNPRSHTKHKHPIRSLRVTNKERKTKS